MTESDAPDGPPPLAPCPPEARGACALVCLCGRVLVCARPLLHVTRCLLKGWCRYGLVGTGLVSRLLGRRSLSQREAAAVFAAANAGTVERRPLLRARAFRCSTVQ